MTCIVAVIKKDKVVMGADSAGVSGLDITIRKDKKIFKNKGFLFGCTSSYRMIQLLMFSFNPPKNKRESLFEYMCTDFIDEVRKCFKEGGFLQKYSDGDDKGGIFLVAYKGRLFMVDGDFQIQESVLDYESVGCGRYYALGSLATTSNISHNAVSRVEIALSAAEKHSAGVSSPFIIKKSK